MQEAVKEKNGGPHEVMANGGTKRTREGNHYHAVEFGGKNSTPIGFEEKTGGSSSKSNARKHSRRKIILITVQRVLEIWKEKKGVLILTFSRRRASRDFIQKGGEKDKLACSTQVRGNHWALPQRRLDHSL